MIQEATPPGRRATRGRPNGSNTRQGGGSGFYVSKMIAPPAAAGIVVGQPKASMYMEDDKFIICRTELAGGVNTSAAFAAGVINLVPHSFPWLNGMAANFSKWKWRKLRFIYIPACPTNTPGQMALSFQYDVMDTTPTTLGQMAMMNGFTNGPYWLGGEGAVMLKSSKHPIVPGAIVSVFDVKRQSKPWYEYITSTDFLALVAVPTVGPAGANAYSPGNVVSASAGGPATVVTGGNLYVQYEIELIEPTDSTLNH